jgi:fumigallin biosynthesis monooxygenase-like protein
MPDVRPGRYGAEIDGDFVVFLIGARLNKPRHVLAGIRDFGGRRRGMQAMLESLMAAPEKGLLGYRMGFPTIVQYWRSFEQLEAFARDPGDLHRPTWLEWFRRDRQGRTGIWHETYLVRAGEYEAVYDSVPESGLAAAGRAVPLTGTSSARMRLRREAVAEPGSAAAT